MKKKLLCNENEKNRSDIHIRGRWTYLLAAVKNVCMMVNVEKVSVAK